MKIKRSHVIAGGAVVLLAAGGVGVAAAGAAGSEDDGSEVPITGSQLDDASAAALEVTGGGRVTGTEVGDEEGYYEVEVTLEDGSQVDVHFDEDLKHLGDETDGPGEQDD